jgi:membrane protein YqaA with SNARE-associated domain
MDSLRELLSTLTAPLSRLFHWVQGLAQSPNAGTALFFLAFAESSFFPIPPDVLLIPLCLGDPSRALWFALVCSLGSVLGGAAGYGIGFYGGRPLLHRFFAPEKLLAVERYFERYNAWAIGIAGLTPLPYKLFTLSGGAFAINFRVFLVASVLSRSLRFFAVAGLIYWFGEPIGAFIEKYFELLSVAFVVLLVGSFWIVGRRANRAAGNGGSGNGSSANDAGAGDG